MPVPTSPTLHLPIGSLGLNHPIYANHGGAVTIHYLLWSMDALVTFFIKKKLQDHFVMQVKDMGSTNYLELEKIIHNKKTVKKHKHPRMNFR